MKLGEPIEFNVLKKTGSGPKSKVPFKAILEWATRYQFFHHLMPRAFCDISMKLGIQYLHDALKKRGSVPYLKR